MEQLQYDPRTKQAIQNALLNALYVPGDTLFWDSVSKLIVRNCLLGGFSHKSFLYKEKMYNIDHTQPTRPFNRLVPQLIPVMKELLKDREETVRQEQPFIKGYINKVLNSSDSFQDYLRLLPAALHRPIMEFSAQCPCRTHKLDDAAVQKFQEENAAYLQLIKQRMVKNLLI